MKALKIIFKVLTVAFLCVFPVFMNILGGSAVIYNSLNNSDPAYAVQTVMWVSVGIAFLVSSFMMIVSTVLLLRGKIRLSVLLETTGLVIFLAAFSVLLIRARRAGISDMELVPYSDIYLRRHLPSVIHSVLVYAYAFIFRSYDEN